MTWLVRWWAWHGWCGGGHGSPFRESHLPSPSRTVPLSAHVAEPQPEHAVTLVGRCNYAGVASKAAATREGQPTLQCAANGHGAVGYPRTRSFDGVLPQQMERADEQVR